MLEDSEGLVEVRANRGRSFCKGGGSTKCVNLHMRGRGEKSAEIVGRQNGGGGG